MLNTEYTHKSRVINAKTSFIFFFPIFYYYFITQPHFSTNPGLPFFFSLSLITVPSLSTDKQNNTTLSLSLSLSLSLRFSPSPVSGDMFDGNQFPDHYTATRFLSSDPSLTLQGTQYTHIHPLFLTFIFIFFLST